MSYKPTPWETDEETGVEYRFVDDDGNPIFEYVIDNRHHSFTMCNVAEQSREWLANVIIRQSMEIQKRAYRLGAESVREPIREALGIRRELPFR